MLLFAPAIVLATAELRLGMMQAQDNFAGAWAAAVMAVQEINSRTDLLPNTTVRFAAWDSACDPSRAVLRAHDLAEVAFDGLGAHAIVGATCSGASKAAAGYLTQAGHRIPLLSPSSTSTELSDGQAHPYFARTAPSDTAQSRGLVDLVAHLLGVERLATVNSLDSYGAMGMREFRRHAASHNMQILASTTFANGQRDFSSSVDVLLRSGALVVVLFCQTQDASPFIEAVQAAGGENITWVGSESVTHAVDNMSPQQLRGFAGLSPAGGAGDAYTGFQSRLGAFEATLVGEGWCSDATDDDGRRLWKTADVSAPVSIQGPVIPPAHCHLIAQSPESRPVCAGRLHLGERRHHIRLFRAFCIRCRVRHRASRRPDAEIWRLAYRRGAHAGAAQHDLLRGVRERELRRKWRSVHGHLVRRLQHGGAGHGETG